MSTVIDRIIELIGMDGINKNQFYSTTKLSNGFLDKPRNKINRLNLENIRDCYPNWNMDWILTGEGEMYKEVLEDDDYRNIKDEPKNQPLQMNNENNAMEILKESISILKGVITDQKQQLENYHKMMDRGQEQVQKFQQIIETEQEQKNKVLEMLQTTIDKMTYEQQEHREAEVSKKREAS